MNKNILYISLAVIIFIFIIYSYYSHNKDIIQHVSGVDSDNGKSLKEISKRKKINKISNQNTKKPETENKFPSFSKNVEDIFDRNKTKPITSEEAEKNRIGAWQI